MLFRGVCSSWRAAIRGRCSRRSRVPQAKAIRARAAPVCGISIFDRPTKRSSTQSVMQSSLCRLSKPCVHVI
jgi:hypothetical protein